MTPETQDIPGPSPPSNGRIRRSWRILADACREAAAGTGGPGTAHRLAEMLLDATGAERAFLVRADARAGPRVALAVSRRSDGSTLPSLTVMRRSLAGRRAVVYPDAARDPRLSTGNSVRALDLRSVITAPVAGDGDAALVVDSAAEAAVRPDVRELAVAFAGLLGLVLRVPSPGGSKPTRPRVSRDTIVGRSPVLRRLVVRARQVAAWPVPVLVTGPTGSGKEGIARLIHREGPRAAAPFVAVNCAALSETLLDAELFGAVRGAYTGLDRDRPGLVRLAHGGTLLLDEVGDMSVALQAKLLRVLQESRVRPVGGEAEHAVDVRVVAATHRDLERRVTEGRFRADLYYRLAVIELRVPPLRRRLEDLPLLVDHAGRRLARKTGFPPPTWTPEALAALAEHDWPGNVRELETVVARAALRAGDEPVRRDHVELPAARPPSADESGRGLEVAMIETALAECGGVLTRAAERIGWTRQKLSRRVAALGIDPKQAWWDRRAESGATGRPRERE